MAVIDERFERGLEEMRAMRAEIRAGLRCSGSWQLESSRRCSRTQPWISQPSVARAASITASANDGCAWIVRAISE